MKANTKTIEFTFERTIPTAPNEVFHAWLNPKIPGNPWNAARKVYLGSESRRALLLDPEGDVPLRPIHGDRAAGSNSAHLGVTEHTWKQTFIQFRHSGWRESTDFRGHCSMRWAVFLLSLKDVLERGKGRPYPYDLEIHYR